jgi:hypothetical protein
VKPDKKPEKKDKNNKKYEEKIKVKTNFDDTLKALLFVPSNKKNLKK